MVATGCVAMLLVAGCAGTAPATHVVGGTMTVTGSSLDISTPADCKGTGGYSDIRQGAPVVIRDQSGTVIATGALGTGVYDNANATTKVCVFAFSVPGVPEATFYAIEVSHRGALNFSRADMAALNWTVELTLG